MCDTISFWATVLSPIVGVIAIIVALVVAKDSSDDAHKQIKAIYNLLDVFVAAQNPNMMTAMQHYQLQLAQLDEQIEAAKEDLETADPFLGRGPRIEDIEYLEDKGKQRQHLDDLQKQRNKAEMQLNLIKSYLDKVTK